MKRGLEILFLCSLALVFLTRAQIAHAATILVDSTSYETLPTINGNCTLLNSHHTFLTPCGYACLASAAPEGL